MADDEAPVRRLAAIVLQLMGEKKPIDQIWPVYGERPKKTDRIVIDQATRDLIIKNHGLDPSKFKPISE